MGLKHEIKKYSKFCAYCGIIFNDYSQKSADHLKPLSKGGKNSLSNIVCSCRACNTQKANQDLKDWLKSKFRRIRLKLYLDYMIGFKKNYSELIYKRIKEAC
jgi:5-methylcytosine-specific restriction endonuclease McrA